MKERGWQRIVFTFAAGSDTSDAQNLALGCFGALIVPIALNTLTVQLLTVVDVGPDLPVNTNLDGANMLATAKTLATGYNPFTADEIARIGCAGPVKLKLSAAPGSTTRVVLWWKS